MQIVTSIFNLLFLLLIAWYCWKKDDSSIRKLYWPALAVKLLAGIALGIIYSTYYQTSDTFIFFQLASQRAELARTDFKAYVDFLVSGNEGYFLGEFRTVFFTKITSIFVLLTNNNYWITSLYFSMLSFFAAWYLVRIVAVIFPEYKIAACIAFLFFPSVVFWSSGVIKESLAMTALFFLTAVFIKVWVRSKVSIIQIILSILSVWVIFNLKYYYLAVFIPVTVSVLAARWIVDRFNIKKPMLQIGSWVLLLILGFVITTFLHPNFSPDKLLVIIVSNNKVFMDACAPDDVIHFYNLTPTWLSMLINSPWAFISGCFRPFIWEANTIFKFFTALENLGVLILTFFALRSVKEIVQSPNRLLILAAVLYCVLLSIFLALSTPNFGTLARYQVGFLPFLVLLVVKQPFIVRPLSKLL